MVCKFCGSYMADGTKVCSRCGKSNETDAFSPAYTAPDMGKPSPFMTAPSLDGTETQTSASSATGGPSRLIVTSTPKPTPTEPAPKPPTFTPTPAAPSFTSAPASHFTPTPAPAPSSFEPPKPVYAPPVQPTPAKKGKKKKETGRRIAGIIALCVFFVCILGVFRLLSDDQKYALHWGEKTGAVDKYIKDELSGFCRIHYDKDTLEKNPERHTPKFEPFIDENQPQVLVFTRYFHVPELQNMKDVELACYFEDRLLSGIELRCEDGAALKTFFCDEFNISQSEAEGVTETQYQNTRVVYFPEENCIFFADMDGKTCVEFLNSSIEEKQ